MSEIEGIQQNIEKDGANIWQEGDCCVLDKYQ